MIFVTFFVSGLMQPTAAMGRRSTKE
ncbi:hypothetical protein ACMD2_16190 [Ananas comosus]|uniref:Uncharacterized protein n=1 Tax=Ananas comosus TaxID=4615 RepID=A0A199W164_ANACO|nr:hypothetical protein ACMD2_16190 [Ananas comosus]